MKNSSEKYYAKEEICKLYIDMKLLIFLRLSTLYRAGHVQYKGGMILLAIESDGRNPR
jgi:hypothetical protein